MFGQTVTRSIVFAVCAFALAFLLFQVIGLPTVELTHDLHAENGAFYAGLGGLIALQLFGTTRLAHNLRITSLYILFVFLVTFCAHRFGGTSGFQLTNYGHVEDVAVYSTIGFFGMLNLITMRQAQLARAIAVKK